MAGTAAAQAVRGFDDPVFDAQAAFRALMDAMARPGQVIAFAPACRPPAGLTVELAGLVLTLADFETPVWLDAALAGDRAIGAYLAFHTGAPLVEAQARSAFAVVSDPGELPPLESFSAGTAEYPDRSTTVLLAVAGFGDGPAATLAGPGVDGRRDIAVDVGPGFWDRLVAARAEFRFPLGVDIVLAAPGCIAALPRSTRIEKD